MKKSAIIGVCAVGVVIVGSLFFFGMRSTSTDDKKTSSKAGTNDTTASKFTQLDACALFTEADAQAIMGATTTAGDNTPPTKSDDIVLSNCSYRNNATNVSDIRIITVTARSPLTQVGVESNKAMFTDQRPSGVTPVEGLGDDAYWDPATHQLALFMDNNWIAVSYGGTNPLLNTIVDARLVADKIVAK